MANPAQWMREAAEEWCEERDTDTTRLLAELIARHAPSEDAPLYVRRESGEIDTVPSMEQVRELVEAARAMLPRDAARDVYAERIRLRRALEPFKEQP